MKYIGPGNGGKNPIINDKIIEILIGFFNFHIYGVITLHITSAIKYQYVH